VEIAKCLFYSLRPRYALAAENLFLRKQLILYMERNLKPRPEGCYEADPGPAFQSFYMGERLKPDTLIRWHRRGFRLLWRWKSKPRGRPRIPAELQKLILEMADDNPS